MGTFETMNAMTQQEFIDSVRRQVDTAAADAAARGEPIPFIFDSDRNAWLRGSLTVTISFETGPAIVIASRVPSALFGSGNSLGLPEPLSDEGARRAAQAVVISLENPYLYN